ncbi:rIIB-like protein [Rhodococcus phage Grayson]|nr:rIIB-like protein [Rhodococcus phage Grayson]
MAKFNHVKNAGVGIVTALIDGNLHTITSEHPHFKEALERLIEVDDDDTEELLSILELFDPVAKIERGFAKVSTQVSIKDGQVLYEGAPIHSALANEIVRFHNNGDDGYEPLAKFLEKVYQNPNENSREMLFDWISAADLTINRDGDIIGYRGLNNNFTSKHSGGAIVNGVPFKGHVPNDPGNVIEMARHEVTFDPNSSCAYGLHIGTYEYAKNWGPVVVECVINPRDVVSVPAYEHDKMRVCRYRVVDRVESKYEDSFVDSGEDFDLIDEDDEYYRDDEETFEGYEAYGFNASTWNDDIKIPAVSFSMKVKDVNKEAVNMVFPNLVVSKQPKDTTKNHLSQKRDANGRFIKKGN